MKYILTGCVCLMMQVCQAQSWIKINTVPSIPVIALEKDNNMLYAASGGNTVYISADNGINWTASTIGAPGIITTSLAVFAQRLYAGTNNNGIFMSSDTGRSWTNTGIGLLTVNSFTEWRNNLYAATLGSGVFVLNQATNNWTAFNSDLPDYSANVFEVINANDSLISAAGANGTFYYYNPVPAKWEENYYFSMLRPGVLVSDMLYSQGSILGVKDGQAIIRSDNNGSDWHFDTTGLQKVIGSDVTIAAGDNYFYAAVNDRLQGGSWIQKHNKVSGTTQAWTIEGSVFTTGYTFAVKEIGSKLFLCRSDGLYYEDMITAVNDPVPDTETFSVYPNPSGGRNITIRSNQVITEVTLFNLAGVCIFRAGMKQTAFRLPFLSSGFYIAQVKVNKKLITRKIIVEN